MSQLEKILIKAKKQVFSEMAGNNSSLFRGDGYDFVELREYMSGDDIRHIDWNISAKMQKPFVKVFREERELNVVISATLSGSMYFGSKKFKQDLVAEIVALLGFSTLRNGDLLSSYIYTDKLEYHHKPSKSIYQVHQLTQEVLEFETLQKKVDYDAIRSHLFKHLRKKSLIFLIGDFFSIPDLKLLAKKHEVVVLIVRDRLEEIPPKMGVTSLLDPENSATIEGDFSENSVEAYVQKVKQHDRELFISLRKDGVRFTKIYTDEYVSVALKRLFEGR